MLVLMGVLIARTLLRDASRHATVIHALAEESRQLENRLRAMNTELALARDFIAAQARDLESLGRIAVDRLSGSAERLQDALAGQTAQIDHVGDVAAKALDNISTLRTHLPVISNSAKDAANAIALAGRTAEVHVEELINGFNRLNEFGSASARKVEEVRGAVSAALDAFALASERIGVAGEVRLRAVIDQLDEQRAQIDREEVAALAAIRARAETLAAELAAQRATLATAEEDAIAALSARLATLDGDVRGVAAALARAIEELGRDHDQIVADSRDRLRRFEESAGALGRALVDEAGSLDDMLAVRRKALDAALNAAADAMAARLESLDTAIGQRRAALAAAAADAADAIDTRLVAIDQRIDSQRQRQLDAVGQMGQTCEALATRIAALTGDIERSAATGARSTAVIDAALATLTSRLDAVRTALNPTDATLADLTDAAVRLLELIEATGEHTRTRIPDALRSTEAGLDAAAARITAMQDGLRAAGKAGTALAETIAASDTRLGTLRSDIAALAMQITAQTGDHERQLAELRSTLRAAQAEGDALTSTIERRLAGAIAELEAAASKAGADLGTTTAAEISALAARLGEETSAALARVVQGRGAQMIARLEQAMDSASASARETAIEMRDHLARIDELAGNLESRVNHIRERAEESVDNDFARRTALITESLNSAAIDITRALSAEVSETAWASYLRGERGIFTRRAVSLLEAGEARAVQQHYETDSEFRTHVNRYIHDFEAMLRQVLSTRDGNALGVTLLSSDMGKLYVALAQGIERLRT